MAHLRPWLGLLLVMLLVPMLVASPAGAAQEHASAAHALMESSGMVKQFSGIGDKFRN